VNKRLTSDEAERAFETGDVKAFYKEVDGDLKKDKWIFLTLDGGTYDNDRTIIENVQVLGYGDGTTAEEAFENFKEKNQYLNGYSFDETYCYKIEENTKKYFSLHELHPEK
jgi:hypothetical protein